VRAEKAPTTRTHPSIKLTIAWLSPIAESDCSSRADYHKKEIAKSHDEIIEAIGWMCRDTSAWAKHHSRFRIVHTEVLVVAAVS
jgi:hypothetical protein